MGKTELFVFLADEPGRIETYFKAWRGGARDWAFLVDAFADLVREAVADPANSVTRPDERRSLGQGARVFGTPAEILKLIQAWSDQPRIRAALDKGSLSIERSLKP